MFRNRGKGTKSEPIPAEVEPVEAVEEQEGPATKDLRIFSAKAIGGGWRDYYVRQLASDGDRIIPNPDAQVIFGGKIIGKFVDFTVTVPGTQTHGSTGAVLAFGDLGLGARKTSATVVVQCGTFTKAYQIQNLNRQAAKKLYGQIAAIEARKQRMLAAIPAEVPAAAVADDPKARLTKLAELHDAGLVTDDEFATQRMAIIGQI